jgi:hypothetical protein
MSFCSHCGSAVQEGHKFCEACGKPVAAEAAPAPLPFVDEGLQLQMVTKLKKARGWILAVGILYVVGGFLVLAISRIPFSHPVAKIILGTNLALAAIHVGLFVWAKREPFAAAVVAMALFISVHLVNFILDPKTITQGIFIKVIFIVVLAQAISAGLAVRRMRAAARTAHVPTP